ncbi:ZIP family metal transporter [Tissierella sp.]|uniref:ZIP family metal transporter n=1 Tax=Tissierella sp. TaxID=41274 RepID=UPI002865CC7C|nr:ZIP family metal transporter [Tissierella sp.]MDR7856962.1 ZIP family metal transporter [Tissierella sp.]
MNPWIVGVVGLIIGIVGISIGSMIGISIKKTDFVLSVLFGLSGGFMMFIVSFHLFPEAFYLGGTLTVITGVTIGILLIIILEVLFEKIQSFIPMKSSIIIGLSIAIHSIPEGLALGSSITTASDFSIVLAMALLMHNIPEGIVLSVPLSMNKVKSWKIILLSTLIGIPTGIGAYLGASLGSLSNSIIPISLAIAGGIMLYIVCDELIPTGKTLHKGRASSIATIIGFILGIIVYF